MLPTELNIAICGHAKHGKSTLAGRLLYELGAISEDELQMLRTEATERNAQLRIKELNAFNWMFLKRQPDTFQRGGEQLDPSRTVFPRRGSLPTHKDKHITLIDTPGYGQVFLDNIVYGIYLADVAVLLVEARAGLNVDSVSEQASGAENITRILVSFQTPVAAIFITKMDVIGYSEAAFQDVKHDVESTILPLLRTYSDSDPPIVPISALSGVGIKTSNEASMPWYSGPSALSIISDCEIKARQRTTRLRVAVEGAAEVYSPPGVGNVIVGSLETGTLSSNDELIIEPASTMANKDITVRVRSLQRARSVNEKSGANEDVIHSRAIVAIAVASDLSRKELEGYLSHGGVLGPSSDRPRVTSEFVGELFFFEMDTVYGGKDYLIFPNASRGNVRVQSIGSRKRLHDLSHEKYQVKGGEQVVATFRMQTPICLDCSADFPRLNRFVLREHNKIVACGHCVQIIA